ncbi:hypothetical protein GQ42DRAFT_163493 [Ramicandelaber brevisporus]|nr:hypothetical protein GQ42DRAFT_163493 [Ramicandelaber brevisporus]
MINVLERQQALVRAFSREDGSFSKAGAVVESFSEWPQRKTAKAAVDNLYAAVGSHANWNTIVPSRQNGPGSRSGGLYWPVARFKMLLYKVTSVPGDWKRKHADRATVEKLVHGCRKANDVYSWLCELSNVAVERSLPKEVLATRDRLTCALLAPRAWCAAIKWSNHYGGAELSISAWLASLNVPAKFFVRQAHQVSHAARDGRCDEIIGPLLARVARFNLRAALAYVFQVGHAASIDRPVCQGAQWPGWLPVRGTDNVISAPPRGSTYSPRDAQASLALMFAAQTTCGFKLCTRPEQRDETRVNIDPPESDSHEPAAAQMLDNMVAGPGSGHCVPNGDSVLTGEEEVNDAPALAPALACRLPRRAARQARHSANQTWRSITLVASEGAVTLTSDDWWQYLGQPLQIDAVAELGHLSAGAVKIVAPDDVTDHAYDMTCLLAGASGAVVAQAVHDGLLLSAYSHARAQHSSQPVKHQEHQ